MVELVAESLVKRYPGVVALDGVSLTVKGGEVHAVAGENGAGKSTLMRVLSGATSPDAGAIRIDGRVVRLDSPHDAHSFGIRMIHQELSLVPELSVAENVTLGGEPARWGIVNRARQQREARAVLDRLGQRGLDVTARIEALPLAARQMAEIAKAVIAQARVLIMDEPTAILSGEEADALFSVVRQLRADGVAIVYISHRLEEIFTIADRVTVLRDGRLVSSAPVRETTRADIVRQMVGRELAVGYPPPAAASGDALMRVDRICSGPVRDASLTVHRGEIVGIVGLVGSGRTELARAVYGAAPLDAGSMTVDGQPYRPRSPRDAIDAGIALLPEDRKAQGLVLIAAMHANISLPSLGSFARGGIVDASREHAEAARWVTTLGIRPPSLDQPVGRLSGGNQQKVVLARWMLANARLLMFDEPTRGIDVGAKAEIYTLMRQLAARGTGILMISSDLPEALGMSDRVLVMRGGRIVGELTRADATADRVARMILGESVAA